MVSLSVQWHPYENEDGVATAVPMENKEAAVHMKEDNCCLFLSYSPWAKHLSAQIYFFFSV